jgi:hypothetical protein
MSLVRVVSRFKDPGVDGQMREIVRAANQLLGNIQGHESRTDNPHQVTPAQIGAETPAGAQAKADAAATAVQTNLTAYIALMGDYAWKKNTATGNLELMKGTVKLADIDASGNLRIRGTLTQNTVF